MKSEGEIMHTTEFARRLRKLRTEKGMTRDAVVTVSGLSLRTLAYVEDVGRITPATLAALSRVYGLDESQVRPMA